MDDALVIAPAGKHGQIMVAKIGDINVTRIPALSGPIQQLSRAPPGLVIAAEST